MEGLFSLSPDEWTAVRLSVKVATAAMLVSLPLGVAVAYLLARFKFPGKALIDGIVLLPLILPPVVTGYLLLLTFGRRGLVGAFLAEHLGIVFSFRWTGADAGFFVPYYDRSRDLELEIGVLPSSEHIGRVNGLVFMNQEELGEISITPNSAETYRFDVPSEALEIGANVLRFVTPTWRPCDYFRTTDRRELGIMLDSITLHYVDRND